MFTGQPRLSKFGTERPGAGVSSVRPARLYGELAVVLYSTYLEYLEYREELEHRTARADLGVLVIK